jgi:hypothetical protein
MADVVDLDYGLRISKDDFSSRKGNVLFVERL